MVTIRPRSALRHDAPRPEPVEKRTAPIDYGHYVEKQLAAAVDSILNVLGTSFARVAGAQMSLF